MRIKILTLLMMTFSSYIFSLPMGYGSINIGMSVEDVKKELKNNSDFGYRGDRDVTLSPSTQEVIIVTDASKNPYSFFTECYFLFVDEKLFSITLNLNQSKIDYHSIFKTLAEKYGNPNSISPKKASWKDSSILMSLEKPLTLKYIDAEVFNKQQENSVVQKNIDEQMRDNFLKGL